MTEKLGIGSTFPKLTLNLVDGGKIDIPNESADGYQVILFYRGHWCPFCRRQLVGFAQQKDALDELGATVIAASVDPIEKAQEVADEVNFPIAYGVTREIADALGSWWEDRRQIIQPSEFILGLDGKVLISSYCDGPLGRMEGEDVVKLIKFYESMKDK